MCANDKSWETCSKLSRSCPRDATEGLRPSSPGASDQQQQQQPGATATFSVPVQATVGHHTQQELTLITSLILRFQRQTADQWLLKAGA